MARSAGTRLPLSWLALAGAIAALAAGAWHYRQFMADDAFISLRYADRLLHGQGLTWNDGEAVEGYTNLLWVLGCALLGRLGLDLVWAARALGVLGTAGAIAAVVWAYRAPTIREALPGIAGGLALALSGPLVVWTFGGLEQPLLAGLLAWALALSFPLIEEERPRASAVLLPGFFFGLIVLTRADGALFTFAACLGILAARGLDRGSVRIGALLALIPLLLFLGQTAFRLIYYHEWLPNSAFAKVGFSSGRAWAGLHYVLGGVYLAGALVPAILAFRFAGIPPFGGRVRFLGVVLAVWLTYLVAVGGDLFPGRRHLVPAVVVIVYLGTIHLARRTASPRPLRPAVVTSALCLAALALSQVADPENARARQEQWEWDGEAVGEMLATAFGARRPLLAVDPAGCVPYFSRLPSVDMLGLNDHYLAHHRPPGFGTGPLGHELGDGAYVLSREPDLVLFNLPTGGREPSMRSGIEMMADPAGAFTATFRAVTLECPPPRRVVSVIWMRTEGGAIGIQRSKEGIRVPGYLFSDNERSRAKLDSEGRMGVAVSPDGPAELAGLAVPTGDWALRVEASGGAVTAHVASKDAGFFASGGTGARFSIAGSGPQDLTILLTTREASGAHVRGIVLERVDGNPVR